MILKKLLLAIILCFGVMTQAKAQDCEQFFVDGVPPIGIKQKSIEQCHDKYALSYSEVTYGNLWSAEHLTKDQILATNQMKRYGRFDSSNRIIKSYRNSGYDRGHMTPSGDMPDVQSQQQTFIWQNIIPQDHKLNTGKWNWIEHQTRNLARKYNDVYVVTGAIFKTPPKMIGQSKVWVPVGVFKAVYIPTLNQSGVYYCENKQPDTCYIVSQEQFTKNTGIDPFPSLDDPVKAQRADLPKPKQ